MNYLSWSNEYSQSAKLIAERIQILRSQQDTAPISQLRELNDRIYMLYTMYLDCQHTADKLYKRRKQA